MVCRDSSLPSASGIRRQAPVVVLEAAVQVQLGALELPKDVLAVGSQRPAANLDRAGFARAGEVGGENAGGAERKNRKRENGLHVD